MEWTESQLPWNIFRRQISTFRDTPHELSGPPRLHRDLPNRTYMYDHAAPYANTLDSFSRISAFLRTDLPWSNSLTTLPPFVRRFYLNMSPIYSDHLDHKNSPPVTTSGLGGYPTQHTHTAPDSKPHKRERTLAHSDSDTERRRSKQQPRSHSVSPSNHHLTHNSAPQQARRIAEETALLTARDPASLANTNPPRISPHPNPMRQRVDVRKASATGTGHIPLP